MSAVRQLRRLMREPWFDIEHPDDRDNATFLWRAALREWRSK